MKFLIAIKDKNNESKNVLDIACRIAEGFSADFTICYVGKKSQAILENDLALTRQSLADWNIYHPGLEVLEWAFYYLKERGFAKNINFSIENLIEQNGRVRMALPKEKNYQINLVLREGELLSELNQELKRGNFDIIILGSPNSSRMTHKLAQFLDTSILFVKNYNINYKYKILLGVDDSKATKRAIIFSTKISKQFLAEIKNVTVSKTTYIGKDYRNAHNWAKKYFKRMKVPFTSKLLGGDPVDEFIEEAGNDHIIILGKSKGNELIKFFKGSKPIQTAQKANCPVLLVN